MRSFSRRIIKLGINPCVDVPHTIMLELFRQAGRSKGPIPVGGKLNGMRFKQTAVRYRGRWRLYLNAPMRLDAGIDVGDIAHVSMKFDPQPRKVPMNPKLGRALARNKQAKKAFTNLTPSRQKEILRYLNSMKTEESAERNVKKVIRQLIGREPKGLLFR